MWELKKRPQSKQLDSQPTPAQPVSDLDKGAVLPKPRSDGKPKPPYEADPSSYWRWNERRAAYMDDQELIRAVQYLLTILDAHGIDDPAAYVGMVMELKAQQDRRARRAYRMRSFASAH